jgi:2'-hydroxyisoflavone reductase
MRFLVLGGTAWLGGQVTSTALALGHQVTCLARGSSGDTPDGAVTVYADRTQPDAYDQVVGDQWDVVIDVSRQPGQVKSAAAALAGRTGFFVFVSSGNVYAGHGTPGQDEGGALLPALAGDVMESMETYGQAKVACEQHLLRAFGPDRALIARVGLIGGPGDIFDRSGYWPLRFARPATNNGAVLVPDAPDLPTQVIDVRDLAAWLVAAGSRSLAGIFNATGETVPLLGHLDVARTVAGHTGPVVSADQQWLLAQGVQEWMGERSLPLWLTDPDWLGFNANDSSKARRAGLSTRPLDQTLADTLAWELSRDRDRVRQAGLSDEDERALLEALAHA